MRKPVRLSTLNGRAADKRTVYRFLFLPKTLPTHDGRYEWRWLELAKIRQQAHCHLYFGPAALPERICRWKDTHWLN